MFCLGENSIPLSSRWSGAGPMPYSPPAGYSDVRVGLSVVWLFATHTEVKGQCQNFLFNYPKQRRDTKYGVGGNGAPLLVAGLRTLRTWWVLSSGVSWEAVAQAEPLLTLFPPFCTGLLLSPLGVDSLYRTQARVFPPPKAPDALPTI